MKPKLLRMVYDTKSTTNLFVTATYSSSTSKITLTIPTEESIVDGKLISFKAPCAGNNLSGIIINGITYTLHDASGVNVCNKSEVFTSGSTVTVAVNKTDSKAYIQNAVKTPHTHTVSDISNISFGTSDPAGGSDGDIYIKIIT